MQKLEREWYIINSRVKVEINDVAISISLWLLENYPITPCLSPLPRWIYIHGLKFEFKSTGLKYGPIFSIRENTKTLHVQLSISIKY